MEELEEEEEKRRIDFANVVLSVVMAIGVAGLAASFMGDSRSRLAAGPDVKRRMEGLGIDLGRLGAVLEGVGIDHWLGRGVSVAHVMKVLVKQVEKWT